MLGPVLGPELEPFASVALGLEPERSLELRPAYNQDLTRQLIIKHGSEGSLP